MWLLRWRAVVPAGRRRRCLGSALPAWSSGRSAGAPPAAAAKPMGGRRPLPLKGEREWLLARIAAKPDLTPACAGAGSCGRWWPSWPSAAPRPATARCGAFSPARGSALKSRHASEQDRLDIARRRARWKMHQGRLDPRRLVFLDETWAKTNMTGRHGRWARGARLVAKLPHRRWRTLTFRAARRHDRIAAPCVIDGPINATSFGRRLPRRRGSSSSWCPPSAPATSSSWTISAATRARPRARLLRAAGAKLFFLPLFARSQPDRARLGQAQDLAAKNRPAHDRGHLAQHRRPSRPLHPDRMRRRPPMPATLQPKRIML